MTSLDALRADLYRARGQWVQIHLDTKIDHGNICRIARGRVKNPTLDTYEKIRRWLDANLPVVAEQSND